MSFRFAVAAAAIICAAAQPAAATVYSKILSQTISFTQLFSTTSQYTGNIANNITLGTAPLFSFARFNPVGQQGQALTLTGIRITTDRAVTGTITLDNGSGNARTGTLQFEVDSTLAAGTLFSLTDQAGNAAIAINIPKQSQGSLGLAGIDTSATNSFNPTSFAPYIGTGTINVTHSISNFLSAVILTSGGSGSLSGSASGSVAGNFTVEYLYNDPLPEPASWAMLVVGFGLAGAALRHKRRNSHANF